ncbi:unnamed protein product [Mytilus edulis]|uniref:Uncharacterized protein n=1 Tax=Mytilus edulis TaxID=6550 RepID=A0A8S3U7T5_MYTED|nr:unnamed protein product [Mytilus edulis]
MKGRYLTYRPDTFRYHFQHQTVLESVMISYSKIEQEVVISMLSFDFIREMVRLQNYRENEGEVILKVSQTLYDKLAERIVEILQSQYFKRTLTFNLQLLYDMQIIREDNEHFITSLLTASHNAYMCSDYNLETDILVENTFRKFKLYFPAAFLEYVGKQTGMHTSLTNMFDHLRSILLNETNDDLLHVCKYFLLQTFFDICEKDFENLLEAAWGVLKLFISFTNHYEYFQNIIDKACISCPITTLEWLFKTFDKEIFEGRRMLLNACQHKRLNSVKFLFKSFKHETFDFNEILIAAVKNVRKESNTEVLQCLCENIKSSSGEMSKSILSVCEIIWPKDMDALLKNADPSLFDSKSILKRAVRNRREGSLECLVKWIITNVNPNILDLTEIMNIVCVLEVLEIGKLLIMTIENKLLDVDVIMIAAIQKYWEGEHESFIIWLISNIDLALFNFKTIEAEACKMENWTK